jgi:flavodoxin
LKAKRIAKDTGEAQDWEDFLERGEDGPLSTAYKADEKNHLTHVVDQRSVGRQDEVVFLEVLDQKAKLKAKRIAKDTGEAQDWEDFLERGEDGPLFKMRLEGKQGRGLTGFVDDDATRTKYQH